MKYIATQNEQRNKYSHDSSKFFVADEYNKNTLKIISINGDYAPCEIQGISENYFWLNNDILAYGIPNDGLYIYNAESREKIPLVQGNEQYKIVTYQNGRLYYDDTNIFYILEGEEYVEEEPQQQPSQEQNQNNSITNNETENTNNETQITNEVNNQLRLDNTHIAYSEKNRGIYVQYLITGEISVVIEGIGDFNLVSYQNGRLYYDNTYIFYILD